MINKKSKLLKYLIIFISLFFIIFLFLIFIDGFNNNKNSNNKIIVENTFKIIKESNIKKDGKVYGYQLLRFKGKDNPSYGIYYPNGNIDNKKETVVITAPYLKIDWSGEKIDSFHLDAVSISKNTESANLFLINNFSVLIVFARFYEKGDINDDVNDIIAGLLFLENKTEKIGIWGSSWGGFEALYASINSPVKPLVGTISYPPSDMELWLNWTYLMQKEYFWKPYQKKIIDGSGGNYSNWDYDYINNNLKTQFLIIHAFEDTLVPFNHSYQLVKNSDKFNEMWLHKIEKELSHGEPTHGGLLPFEHTISTIYLMSKLTSRDLISAVDKKAIDFYINDLELFQNQGININWSILLFENLFKPNIKYYDLETSKLITSQELKLEFQPKLSRIGIVIK
jgi:hypothetical protein